MKNLNRNILIGLGVIFLVWALWFFSDIVVYILSAWVLSVVGGPLMRLFQRIKFKQWRVGPTMAALMTLSCFFLVIFAFFALFAPLIFMQARNLAAVDYSMVAKGLEVPLQHFSEYMAQLGLIEETDQSPTEFIKENVFKNFSPSNITLIFSSIIGFTGNLLVFISSVVFMAFFFLKENQLFVRALLVLTPVKYHDEINNILSNSIRLLTRYFGGIVLQVTLITLFVSSFLALLGVPNALLIGFFAALINIIPYLGPALGGSFGVFIAISSNLDADFYLVLLPMIGKVVLVFAVMQMLDNFLLQPFIFSNSVMAHPMEVFIVILAGAKLGGVVGMVLAIPVYTVARVVLRVFWSEFHVVERLTKSLNETDVRKVT